MGNGVLVVAKGRNLQSQRGGRGEDVEERAGVGERRRRVAGRRLSASREAGEKNCNGSISERKVRPSLPWRKVRGKVAGG